MPANSLGRLALLLLVVCLYGCGAAPVPSRVSSPATEPALPPPKQLNKDKDKDKEKEKPMPKIDQPEIG